MTGSRGTAPASAAAPTRGRAFAGRACVALLVVGLVLVGGSSFGYYGVTAAPGSRGGSSAATVQAGNAPTATVSGYDVTLNWQPSTVGAGHGVAGYTVQRYDAATMTPQKMLNACAGKIVTTTCTEVSVPTGTWVYTVTPVVGNWAGAESPASARVVVDATAPTDNLSLNLTSGHAVLSGHTVYYAGSAAGSFTLTNAVSDSGSGPASSATSALSGTTTGWSHTPSTVSTPAGGPFTSAAFSWTAGTSASPTEVVTGRDVAGNAAPYSLTFVNDSNGPTGGSAAITGLGGTGGVYSTSTTLHLQLAKGTDPNGVAVSGATLLRASAPLTSNGGADGVCGTFGSFSAIATDPGSSYDDSVSDGTCYTYQYVVSDTLGYPTVYVSNTAKVDTTAPAAPMGTFSEFSSTYAPALSPTFYYNPTVASGSIMATPSGTDASSGIASYNFPALGTNWSTTKNADGSVTYSWSGAPAAPGTKYVTATNNAGLTSGGQPFYPTADGTAPSLGTVNYANTVQSTTTVSITLVTGTDSGSGTGATYLQRASATYSGSACGTFGSFTTVATNPGSVYTDNLSRGYCYRYQYVETDHVGNTSTATSAAVVKVVPSYSSLITATAGLTNFWRLGEASGTTMVDSKGGVNGTYVNSPTRGVTGAFGDGNTAVTFDGVSAYATVNKTLAGNFTVEFSFKSTQGLGGSTATQWWQGAGLVDADVSSSTSKDWGISLRGDGKIMAGDGDSVSPGDKTAISSGSYDDGTWHLVDVTRTQSTGLVTIYVDGLSVGSVTGTTTTLTSPTVAFGKIESGTNYFAGTLDDVSFYSSALSASVISSHFMAAGY